MSGFWCCDVLIVLRQRSFVGRVRVRVHGRCSLIEWQEAYAAYVVRSEHGKPNVPSRDQSKTPSHAFATRLNPSGDIWSCS